jgi:hypothetical protein
MKWFEALVGPPMAAPETTVMRRLRHTFISLAALSALGIVSLGLISAVIGRAATGGVLLLVMSGTVLIGIVYFVRKTRADDAWFDGRQSARDGEGEGL